MTETYKAIPINELPYPHGLGKGEYPKLGQRMKRLLGEDKWMDPCKNQKNFWTDEYQAAIREFLAPEFDAKGDIRVIAAEALDQAQKHQLFDTPLRNDAGVDPEGQYIAILQGQQQNLHGEQQEVQDWVFFPPRVEIDGSGELAIGDGRHRLSYLRSLVEKEEPDFPVFVRYCDYTDE